jgi:hypothetical protein
LEHELNEAAMGDVLDTEKLENLMRKDLTEKPRTELDNDEIAASALRSASWSTTGMTASGVCTTIPSSCN